MRASLEFSDAGDEVAFGVCGTLCMWHCMQCVEWGDVAADPLSCEPRRFVTCRSFSCYLV